MGKGSEKEKACTIDVILHMRRMGGNFLAFIKNSCFPLKKYCMNFILTGKLTWVQ